MPIPTFPSLRETSEYPFDKQEAQFYKGIIDFDSLLRILLKRDESFVFELKKILHPSILLLNKAVSESVSANDFYPGVVTPALAYSSFPSFNIVQSSVETTVSEWEVNERRFNYSMLVNLEDRGYLDYKPNSVKLTLLLDGTFYAEFVYQFKRMVNGSEAGEFIPAFAIGTKNLEAYKVLYEHLDFNFSKVQIYPHQMDEDWVERDVRMLYNSRFDFICENVRKDTQNAEKLVRDFYNYIPQYMLYVLDKEEMWKQLAFLLDKAGGGDVKERAILNLMDGITRISEDEIDPIHANQFLDRFINYFDTAYKKMQNVVWGQDSFITFTLKLWEIWSASRYVNPDEETFTSYQSSPPGIAYFQDSFLGFSNNNIALSKVDKRVDLDVVKSITTAIDDYGIAFQSTTTKETNQFSYHMYQPMYLYSINEDGTADPTPIKTKEGYELPAIFPAICLKAFDDRLKWKNIVKGVWLAVDVITTLIGVGNLLKLRYLRIFAGLAKSAKATSTTIKAANLSIKIKGIIGTVEVSASTLRIMLDTVADCNTEFCEKMKNYLTWVEVTALSSDALTAKFMKSAADDLLKYAGETGPLTNPSIIRHLDEIADSKTDVKIIFKSGEVVSLNRFYWITIKQYVKRAKAQRIELRNQFNKNIRKAFVLNLLTDSDKVKVLKTKLPPEDIKRMGQGFVPKGYEVHHKIPLDDGGTNSFDNLMLIKNNPYHRALNSHYMQQGLTRVPDGAVLELEWPFFDGFIYP